MKVLFVWVSVNSQDPVQFLPLGIGYLAANLPQKIKVRLWDGIVSHQPNSSILRVIRKFKPDVVAFSVWNFNFSQVCETTALIKKKFPKLTIVLGGVSVSGYKNRIFEFIDTDYAFVGEGEKPFAQFLELFLAKKLTDESKRKINGLIFRGKDGSIIANPVSWGLLDNLNPCDYKFINLNKYLKQGYYYGVHSLKARTAPILTTRGCPFPCEFCSARLINGKVVRLRPVNSVISEIKKLHSRYKITGFNIIDDNFTFNMEYAKEILREILRLNLKDVSFCCPNGVKLEYLDEELLSLMKKAGWRFIYIAPESGSVKTLKRMHKLVKLPLVKEKIRLIKKFGIKVFGFFMIGYPGETTEDIKQTINFARRYDFDAVAFAYFKPLPGTPVFEKLYSSGQIGPDSSAEDYFTITYTPDALTVRQLKFWRFWGLFRFYTSSFKRFKCLFMIYPPKRFLFLLTKVIH